MNSCDQTIAHNGVYSYYHDERNHVGDLINQQRGREDWSGVGDTKYPEETRAPISCHCVNTYNNKTATTMTTMRIVLTLILISQQTSYWVVILLY